MCLKTEVLPKILKKKWNMNQKFSFWIRQKSALFIAVSEETNAVQPWISAVSEKISTDTALFQRWFWALKIFVFSAVQSWFSAVQRFSGNEQRWNRPEIILNQSWSALNVSETSTRDIIFFGNSFYNFYSLFFSPHNVCKFHLNLRLNESPKTSLNAETYIVDAFMNFFSNEK